MLSDDLTPTPEDRPAELRALLNREITAFNFAATGIWDGQDVAFSIREADGEVAAGLTGWTWGGCLCIECLWVRADRRGRGFGRALIARAEELGRERGCFHALVGTHSFQAPEFYARLGYRIYAATDNYPIGHQQLFLKKPLG